MGKKQFFNDFISDDEPLGNYPRLKGEGGGVKKNDPPVSDPHESSNVSESVPEESPAPRRGRPKGSRSKKEKDSDNNKRIRAYISHDTYGKIRLYAGYSGLDGVSLTADQIISKALDVLLNQECPELAKKFLSKSL